MVAKKVSGFDNLFIIKGNQRNYYFDDVNDKIYLELPEKEINERTEKDSGYVEAHNKRAAIKIIPTNSCQLSCKYCYSAKDRAITNLEFKNIKSILENLIADNELIEISFTGGGEPTINFGLIRDVVEFIESKGIKATYKLSTNGLFNADVLDFLATYNFLLSISLDGTYEENIYQQANEYSLEIFNTIINNIKKYLLLKKYVHINCIFSIELLEKFPWAFLNAADFIKDIGIKIFTIDIDSYSLQKKLSQKQLNTIIENCTDLIRWYNEKNDVITRCSLIYKSVQYSPAKRCGSLYNLLGIIILPDGTSTFCHRIQESVGSVDEIMTSKLKPGLNYIDTNNYLRIILEKYDVFRQKCTDCIARQICELSCCPMIFYETSKGGGELTDYCSNLVQIRIGILKRQIE